MIEPAVFLEGLVGKEPERFTCPFLSLIVSDPTAIGGDAESGETEAGRGYARYIAMVLIQRGTVHAGTIGNEPGIRISLIPEVLKGVVLEILKELMVFA